MQHVSLPVGHRHFPERHGGQTQQNSE